MSAAFPAYAGVRVLVFGASGFIGRWVARLLTEAGADLWLGVRDTERARAVLEPYGVKGSIVRAPLAGPLETDRVFDAARPTVTFNLTGYGVDRTERDPDLASLVNDRAVRWIVRAAGSRAVPGWPGAHVVHAGSALEYGILGGHLVEDADPIPTTLYGRTKLAGTVALLDECRERGIRGIVGRLFTVYGPGEQAGRLLPALIDAAERGSPVALSSGEQRRDFTFVEDAAEGLLRLGCAEGAPSMVVNIATGRLTTVRRFAELAAAEAGLPLSSLQFGALESRTDDMAHDDVTIARLQAVTGWVPSTSITDGVRRTLAFRGTRLTASTETPH
jgi:nucleoside-diphosphate-sugar epimerase